MKTPTLKGIGEEFDKEFPNNESGYQNEDGEYVWIFSPAVNVRDIKAFLDKKMLEILKYLEMEEKHSYNIVNPNCPGKCASCGVDEGMLHKSDCKAYHEAISNQAVSELNKKLKEIKG